MKPTPCELCKEPASVYCPSDSAFLCRGCDARVHQANFLVARHVRLPLCSGCGSLSGHRFSGAGGIGPGPSILCLSCSDHLPVDAGSLSPSSSSSACISSTESSAAAPKKKDECSSGWRKLEKTGLSSSLTNASGEGSDSPARLDGAAAFSGEVSSGRRNGGTDDRRARTARSRRETTRIDPKAAEVFAIWCRKLGLSGGEAVAVASRALRVTAARPTALPLRVAMAASFLVAMRSCKGRGVSTWQNLKRVEEASGVPAKLILAGEAKLARGARGEKALGEERLEEGWAECTA